MPSEAAADRAPPEPGESRKEPPDSVLLELRRAIGRIEKKYASLEGGAAVVPFGVAALDAALGGGLVKGALHEVVAAGGPNSPAAAGFALLVAARVAARPLVWIGEDMAAHESGSLYGLGLDELGIAPERLIVVRAARTADALWAMEEALRCRALAGVIGEFRTGERIDDVATRRLSLAANHPHGFGVLLHATPAAPVPAATRFIVAAARSARARHAIGPAAFRIDLVRNRFGTGGSWTLEWNSVGQRFDGHSLDPAAADPQPVAATARDRSHRASAA